MINKFSEDKRIDWIDLCKALAIIAVIIGHTVQFGTFIRNFIFSFHMPLFFILSGFTFKIYHSTKEEFFSRMIKDARHLLLPVLAVVVISFFYGIYLNYSNLNLLSVITNWGKILFWASGVEVYRTPPIGMVWFLISLFGARTLLSFIFLKFSNEEGMLLAFGLGFIGILIGARGVYLPLNFDITFVACLYMVCGILIKNYYYYIKHYKLAIFIAVTLIWLYCLSLGIYIELAARSYPYFIVALVESLAASLSIMLFIETLSFFSMKKIFLLIGRNTLTIFVVHALDFLFFELWGGKSSVDGVTAIFRLLSIFVISIIVLFLINLKKKLRFNEMNLLK